MSGTYQTTGIILHKILFQENDLLVTFLSPELGLIRAIAPSARKYKSRLRGRTELFVVNNFLLVKGRNLDRITQAETIESYPKLSQNISKLTVSQYLAEISLNLAFSEHPQEEFYELLTAYLKRIEQSSISTNLFPLIAQAIFDFLIVAGISPEVNYCINTREKLIPNFTQSNWQVGFSFLGGGLINFNQLNNSNKSIFSNKINHKFNPTELDILQSLSHKYLTNEELIIVKKYSDPQFNNAWIKVERTLKDYLEFHLGKKLKSAEMITDILLTF